MKKCGNKIREIRRKGWKRKLQKLAKWKLHPLLSLLLHQKSNLLLWSGSGGKHLKDSFYFIRENLGVKNENKKQSFFINLNASFLKPIYSSPVNINHFGSGLLLRSKQVIVISTLMCVSTFETASTPSAGVKRSLL